MCPEVEPAEGTSCSVSGLLCTYGDAIATPCRPRYECDGTQFHVVDMENWCNRIPEGYCPETPQHEKPCTFDTGAFGIPCDYGEVRCSCDVYQATYPGAKGTWVCFGPPRNTDCPSRAPNLGEGCSVLGTACNYFLDACQSTPGMSVYCFAGAWEDSGISSCN